MASTTRTEHTRTGRPGRRGTAWALALALTAGIAVTAGTGGATGDEAISSSGAPATAATDMAEGATKTVTQQAEFSATDALWGGAASGSVAFDLFDESFSEGGTFGRIREWCLGISEIDWRECVEAGAEITASIEGSMSMSIALDIMGEGTVNVEYPITVEFTAPDDNSFDPGDEITISTSIEVGSDASITVDFPEFGSFTLDAFLALDAFARARICFVRCESTTFIDEGGAAEFDLLDLDRETFDFVGGCYNPLFKWLLGLGSYENDRNRCNNGGYVVDPEPWFTTTITDGHGLQASGDDVFSVFPVSGVSWAARATLPWYALPNLDPVSYRGVEIGWSSFDVITTALTTLEQHLTFEPTVEIDLDWGRELHHRIDDEHWTSATGATLIAGQDLHLRTDAELSSILTVSPIVRLSGTDVTDRSTITTSGNLELRALGFTIETPPVEICAPDPFGCERLIGRQRVDAGPVLRSHRTIGQDDTVELFDGSYPITTFEEIDLDPFEIVPRPRIEIRSEVRPVNAPGTFDLLLDDGSGAEIVAGDVADGGSSGPIVLHPGGFEISVDDGVGGDLAYFDVHIECVERADENTVHTERLQVRTATSDVPDQDFEIELTGGEDLICTVLIRLPVPWECDSMTFTNVILGDPRSSAGEILHGTTSSDIIVGYGGDDLIIGIGGDDCVAGGTGNDRIILGPGRSVADTGPGDNHVVAGAGDRVFVGAGTNRVNGSGATVIHEQGR